MDESIRSGFNEYLSRVEDELERFVRRVLLKIQADTVKIIRDNKAVGYSQELIKNIRIEVSKQAAKIIGIVGVGANVPYGIFRHEGTKPHFPPLEPIMKWLVYKGFIKKSNKITSLNALKKANQENQVRQVAFLIARKISKKGTTGLKFLEMALNMNLDFIASEILKIKI